MALVELLQEAGMPKGVVNIIHGQHDTVNFICDNPDIKAISFVGEKISAMVLSYEIQINIFNFFDNLMNFVGRGVGSTLLSLLIFYYLGIPIRNMSSKFRDL